MSTLAHILALTGKIHQCRTHDCSVGKDDRLLHLFQAAILLNHLHVYIQHSDRKQSAIMHLGASTARIPHGNIDRRPQRACTDVLL